MDLVAQLARLLLTGVFALAGLAKSVNVAASRKAIADFGVPSWLAGPVGSLLPIIELALAVLLIPGWSAWGAALASLTLLMAFVVAIAGNLLAGRTPDCNCFGQLEPTPIGWATVVRNAALAGCAGLVVALGPERANVNAVSGIGGVLGVRPLAIAVGIAVVVALAAQTFFVWHLFRQNGRLLVRMDGLERRLERGPVMDVFHGLPIGAPAPPFELPAVAGGTVRFPLLRQGGTSIVLLFADPNCGPCAALLPAIREWQEQYADRLLIVVISRGDGAANLALAQRHGLERVLLQRESEVAEAYRVTGTPAGVFIRADGSIGASLALGHEAIAAMLRAIDAEPQPAAGHVDPPESASAIGLTYGTAIR